MKKTLLILATISTLFVFSSCDHSRRSYYHEDDMYVYHLVDQEGFGVGDVRYTCDDGYSFDYTTGSGAFYFYDGDDCDIELHLANVDSARDRLYIEDAFGHGARGIEYICDNGDEGYTNRNGRFYFDNIERYDVCTFLL